MRSSLEAFAAVENVFWRSAPTLYYIFDILWRNGEDPTGNTIMDRRSVLESALKSTPGIQLGNYVEAQGKTLFELTKEKGMEGIIAKRKDGLYRPGKRTSDWLKIKARLQQEFVFGNSTTVAMMKSSEPRSDLSYIRMPRSITRICLVPFLRDNFF